MYVLQYLDGLFNKSIFSSFFSHQMFLNMVEINKNACSGHWPSPSHEAGLSKVSMSTELEKKKIGLI